MFAKSRSVGHLEYKKGKKARNIKVCFSTSWWVTTRKTRFKMQPTSSLLIISTWSLLLNSSHSSLYLSISSLVCLIFFLSTSRRDPCWMVVDIFFNSKSHTTHEKPTNQLLDRIAWVNWASHRGKWLTRVRLWHLLDIPTAGLSNVLK